MWAGKVLLSRIKVWVEQIQMVLKMELKWLFIMSDSKHEWGTSGYGLNSEGCEEYIERINDTPMGTQKGTFAYILPQNVLFWKIISKSSGELYNYKFWNNRVKLYLQLSCSTSRKFGSIVCRVWNNNLQRACFRKKLQHPVLALQCLNLLLKPICEKYNPC